jgi:hypothetical protein
MDQQSRGPIRNAAPCYSQLSSLISSGQGLPLPVSSSDLRLNRKTPPVLQYQVIGSDGLGDLLWRDNSGDLAVWLMNSATVMSSARRSGSRHDWSLPRTLAQ